MKRALVILLIGSTALPTFADVYKCTAANGKVEFQGAPCDSSDSEAVVHQSTMPNDENLAAAATKPIEALTIKDLAGVWRADYGGGLKEEWIFTTGGLLIHHSYKGRTIQSQYSFSKGVIVVHHTPALAKPYDEEMKIIRWKGDEMEWRSMVGTTVTAHRK